MPLTVERERDGSYPSGCRRARDGTGGGLLEEQRYFVAMTLNRVEERDDVVVNTALACYVSRDRDFHSWPRPADTA
jgi:hypothetical protein